VFHVVCFFVGYKSYPPGAVAACGAKIAGRGYAGVLWQSRAGRCSCGVLLIFTHMLKALHNLGIYFLMLRSLFTTREKISIYVRATLAEIHYIGVGSVPIVLITALFIGAVTTVNTAYQLESAYFPLSLIGSVMSTTSIMEFAPTITSLVLAGQVGGNIASQLGTMRVTEQIDALDVMGVNSTSYLILPKLLGALVAFPTLIIFAVFLQHLGGIMAGEFTGIIPEAIFHQGVMKVFEPFQITFMLTKALTFGFLITSISAYQGYYVRGGAFEVGDASKKAVVRGSIAILCADYALAEMML
ncbi:MAG: MlaE family ABC transporter permease, partial [Sphingobacteriia bacterium]